MAPMDVPYAERVRIDLLGLPRGEACKPGSGIVEYRRIRCI